MPEFIQIETVTFFGVAKETVHLNVDHIVGIAEAGSGCRIVTANNESVETDESADVVLRKIIDAS